MVFDTDGTRIRHRLCPCGKGASGHIRQAGLLLANALYVRLYDLSRL